MSAPSLPPNARVSKHPCLRAKLSQLRTRGANARETKLLIHEIATIVGCEALGECLQSVDDREDQSALGYPFVRSTVSPASISVVPILRSGLSMVDAISSLLPYPVPVHHLGLYREKTTLQPVEYYNNLPYHRPNPASQSAAGGGGQNSAASELAIIVDPVIATGSTMLAAIETLRDWGVRRIVCVSVLASEQGLRRCCEAGGEGVEIWVAGVDAEVDDKGMIKPGLGDVGDRLYLTIGK